MVSGQLFDKKKTYNEFEIATAIFGLSTTIQTAAQVTSGGGIRSIRGRGSEGPHHHQQDFMIFSLRRGPSLLVINVVEVVIVVVVMKT